MQRLALIGRQKPILAALSTTTLLVVGLGCWDASPSDGRLMRINTDDHRPKRFLAREIYQRVMTDFRARQEIIQAA